MTNEPSGKKPPDLGVDDLNLDGQPIEPGGADDKNNPGNKPGNKSGPSTKGPKTRKPDLGVDDLDLEDHR